MDRALSFPLACLGLFVFGHPLQSAEREDLETIEKRIAQHVEKMQDEDPSTAGTVAAIGWEEQQWDALLNSAYRTLMEKLPEKAKTALRSSQRAWLSYRNAEREAQLALFATRDGTMYSMMAADARMRIVKHRATELASLLRVWEIDGN